MVKNQQSIHLYHNLLTIVLLKQLKIKTKVNS